MQDFATNNPLLFGLLLAAGITVLVLGILAIVFGIVFRAYRADPRIAQEGQSAEATIVRTWSTGVRSNQKFGIGMELDVRRPGYEPYRAKARALVPMMRIGEFKEGSIIPVKIHPDDPQKIMVDMRF